MRFPSPVAIVVFLVVVGLVGPVEAKPGKGGGGGRAQVSRGGGGKQHGGAKTHGQGGSKRELAQSKHGGPDKVTGGKSNKEKLAKGQAPHEKTDKIKSDKSKTAKNAAEHEHDGLEDPADDAGDTTPYNKKEKQLANFQRQRDKKLAQAEHLRQIAERNGNANLLANADRMEAQAYEQYARKVSHLEKFGVTDPALDLDGDGFADPWSPPTDPLDPLVDPLDNPLADELLADPLQDPLGTLQSLLPLGR